MIKITERKNGKKSVFYVETFFEELVVDFKIVKIENYDIKHNGKEFFVLYNSDGKIIKPVYDFINHNDKKLSNNSKKAALNAIKYLYIYSEITGKDIFAFNKDDFIHLIYFLAGISNETLKYTFNIKTKRSCSSIINFFSIYREFYKYLELFDSAILQEPSFIKYFPEKITMNSDLKLNKKLPVHINPNQFNDILNYIKTNSLNEENKLRNECIVRLMYEYGCRLGEVLGLTLEDIICDKENNIYKLIIRNRLSDDNFQNAKTCMSVFDIQDYNSEDYLKSSFGYQTIQIKKEMFDILNNYISEYHKKYQKNNPERYFSNTADMVSYQNEILFNKNSLTQLNTSSTNNYVFLNNRGEPLTDEGWNKELRKVFTNMGISTDTNVKRENLSQRLRHGFIIHLIYDLKLPRTHVQMLSRNRDNNSLDIYYQQVENHF